MQAECEMVNSGTKPIFKLYGANLYEKGIDMLQTPLFTTNWFRKYPLIQRCKGPDIFFKSEFTNVNPFSTGKIENFELKCQ